jgi:beta-ureidopropionase
MAHFVRAAISQTTWTGDQASMLDKHEGFARDSAAQGAQVICFQELFYGPYFGITQDKKYYVDADGTVLGKYRKNHIPHVEKFWEKFYFRPGNLGYPVFETAIGKVGMYICYDRHFPEGWRELGLNGAHIVFNPNATKPGLSNRLWEIEQPAAAVANGYFVLAPNRVGREDNEYGDEAVDFYGTSQVVDPRGNYVGALGSSDHEELLVRDLDLDLVRQMRDDWQFYRDRRPDSYRQISQP